MPVQAQWRVTDRPLGCNGHYGNSGVNKHWRRHESACQPCRDSAAHLRWVQRSEAREAPLSPAASRAEQQLAAMRAAKKAGEELALGCNGKFGESGYNKHRRAGTIACRKCLNSRNQWYRFKKPPRQPGPKQRAVCGTMRAVWQHLRHKETMDEACKLAHNTYDRERKRQQRGSK